jgi:hypothetical protein
MKNVLVRLSMAIVISQVFSESRKIYNQYLFSDKHARTHMHTRTHTYTNIYTYRPVTHTHTQTYIYPHKHKHAAYI